MATVNTQYLNLITEGDFPCPVEPTGAWCVRTYDGAEPELLLQVNEPNQMRTRRGLPTKRWISERELCVVEEWKNYPPPVHRGPCVEREGVIDWAGDWAGDFDSERYRKS